MKKATALLSWAVTAWAAATAVLAAEQIPSPQDLAPAVNTSPGAQSSPPAAPATSRAVPAPAAAPAAPAATPAAPGQPPRLGAAAARRIACSSNPRRSRATASCPRSCTWCPGSVRSSAISRVAPPTVCWTKCSHLSTATSSNGRTSTTMRSTPVAARHPRHSRRQRRQRHEREGHGKGFEMRVAGNPRTSQ